MASYIRKPGILIIDHPDPPDYCNIGQAAPVGLEFDISGKPTLFLAAPGGDPNSKCYLWKITADDVEGPYLVLDKGSGDSYNCPAVWRDGFYVHVLYSAASCYQTEYQAKAPYWDLNNWRINEVEKPEAGAFHYGTIFWPSQTVGPVIISNIDDPPYNGNPWQLHRILHCTVYGDRDLKNIVKCIKIIDYSKELEQRTDLPITAMRVYSKRLMLMRTHASMQFTNDQVIIGAYRIYLGREDVQEIYYPYMGAFMIHLGGAEGTPCKVYDIFGNEVKEINQSEDVINAVEAKQLELLSESWDNGYGNFMINIHPLFNSRLFVIGGHKQCANSYILEINQENAEITIHRIPWLVSEDTSNHFGVGYVRDGFIYFPNENSVFIGKYRDELSASLYLNQSTKVIGDIYRQEADGSCHKNAKLYHWVAASSFQSPDKLILFNNNVLSAYLDENYLKPEYEPVKEYIKLQEGGIYGD